RTFTSSTKVLTKLARNLTTSWTTRRNRVSRCVISHKRRTSGSTCRRLIFWPTGTANVNHKQLSCALPLLRLWYHGQQRTKQQQQQRHLPTRGTTQLGACLLHPTSREGSGPTPATPPTTTRTAWSPFPPP
ncbi:unnamed protein product, partial [Ectocarpus sp. 12 AP-2014]